MGLPTQTIKDRENFGKRYQIQESSTKRFAEVSASNHIERLPDELIERIMNFAGVASDSHSMGLDPYETGWKDDEELLRRAISFGRSVAILRLVCWRFFHLGTPLFFKRLVICDSSWGSTRQPTQFMLKLSELLSTPRPTASITQQIPANSVLYSPRNRSCYHVDALPYGHHVRQLIISNRAASPLLIGRLIDMIHSLIPNVTTLSGLNLSYMPFFLSPIIRFPRLASISIKNITPSSEAWADDHPRNNASLNHVPTYAQQSNLISQEIFLGMLNNHPLIASLACRGLHMNESTSKRILALLRINQLSIPLQPSCRRSDDFTGLKILHFGANSVIDLHLIRLLPSVAPQLQQLHIDAGCQLEEKATSSLQPWSLTQLLTEFPRLTHLTFIAHHSLPNRQGSTEWASSNKILSTSPFIQSLNLRMDSLTSCSFFEHLTETMALRKLNIWHRPALSLVPQSWSIISFESSQQVAKLGHIVCTMKKGGLEWPKVEEQQRDLWLKLKVLCQAEISGN